MSERKRLVFIASRVPYPPLGGDKLKNYHLITELSREFELTLIVMGRGKLDLEARTWLESCGKLYYIPLSTAKLFTNIVRGLFSVPTPLQVTLYHNEQALSLTRRLASDHDAIFCSLVRTAQFAEGLDIPCFCDYSDSIGQHYQHSLPLISNPIKRKVYALESRLMLRYEAEVLSRFDVGFFLNHVEMQYFKQPDRSAWVPLGCDEKLLEYDGLDASMARSLVFFGKMDYAPNKLAVEWFVRNVMPLLPSEIDLHIIGAFPAPSVRALEGPRVKVRGFIEDPYAMMRGSLAVIAPMQTGGGVQNKLLEAMALGCVTVNSSRTVLPLQGVEAGRHLLVADEPAQYSELIRGLYEKTLSVSQIGEQARKYIRENHAWSLAGYVYRSKITKCIERHNAALHALDS